MSSAEARQWQARDGGKRTPVTKFDCGCASCAVHRERRTEAAMAAQVLAKLLVDGLIPSDAVRLSATCRAVGVAIAEVQAAWRVVDAGRFVKPEHIGQCLPDRPSGRHADAVKSTKRYRQAHEGLPEGHKRCSRCEGPKPLEDFAIKDSAVRPAEVDVPGLHEGVPGRAVREDRLQGGDGRGAAW